VSYTLTIRERNYSWAGRSPLRGEYATEVESEAALRNYVAERWDKAVGTDRPDDPEEMVDMYLTVVHEAYEIVEEDHPRRRRVAYDKGRRMRFSPPLAVFNALILRRICETRDSLDVSALATAAPVKVS
jgi:hypothetical protein